MLGFGLVHALLLQELVNTGLNVFQKAQAAQEIDKIHRKRRRRLCGLNRGKRATQAAHLIPEPENLKVGLVANRSLVLLIAIDPTL